MWRRELTAEKKITFAHLAQHSDTAGARGGAELQGGFAKLQKGSSLGLNPNLTSL